MIRSHCNKNATSPITCHINDILCIEGITGEVHIDENGDGDVTYELQVFENSAFRELGYFTPIEKKLVMFDNVKVSTAMLVYTVAMSRKRKYMYINPDFKCLAHSFFHRTRKIWHILSQNLVCVSFVWCPNST